MVKKCYTNAGEDIRAAPKQGDISIQVYIRQMVWNKAEDSNDSEPNQVIQGLPVM